MFLNQEYSWLRCECTVLFLPNFCYKIKLKPCNFSWYNLVAWFPIQEYIFFRSPFPCALMEFFFDAMGGKEKWDSKGKFFHPFWYFLPTYFPLFINKPLKPTNIASGEKIILKEPPFCLPPPGRFVCVWILNIQVQTRSQFNPKKPEGKDARS